MYLPKIHEVTNSDALTRLTGRHESGQKLLWQVSNGAENAARLSIRNPSPRLVEFNTACRIDFYDWFS